MGYTKIDNLYRPEAQRVLGLPFVYVTEKIHGSSACIRVNTKSGGWTSSAPRGFHDEMVGIVQRYSRIWLGDGPDLLRTVKDFCIEETLGPVDTSFVIYGELYGGRMQGMSKVYGQDVLFMAFDVLINGRSIDSLVAQRLCQSLHVPFVPVHRVRPYLPLLDAFRDSPSEVSEVESDHREGIVIRGVGADPPKAKHKRAEYLERRNQPPPTVDITRLQLVRDAQSIVDEWVVPARIRSIVRKNPGEGVGHVLDELIKDIVAESSGEVAIDSETAKQIKKLTGQTVRKIVEEEASHV